MCQLGGTRWPRIPQKCYIGGRSGDWDGQSRGLTRPACKQFLGILQVWDRGLSCWKGKLFQLDWTFGVNDFIHKALVCKCAHNNNQAHTVKYVN